MNRYDLEWIRRCLVEHEPRVMSSDEFPSRAAVAAILRESTPGGCCELLFILRARHELDPWSGQMAFPGGRVQEEDAGLEAAARRETQEEVGIDLGASAELLGRSDDLQARARGRMLPLVITPFVFRLTKPVEAAASHEVEEIHWVPVPELLDPRFASTLVYDREGGRRELPCFRVRGQVIWGLTHMMLMRLFEIRGWDTATPPRLATPRRPASPSAEPPPTPEKNDE
jgi:8-oxo-dGTP pyrophosphatase MutT (NUDIX family)